MHLTEQAGSGESADRQAGAHSNSEGISDSVKFAEDFSRHSIGIPVSHNVGRPKNSGFFDWTNLYEFLDAKRAQIEAINQFRHRGTTESVDIQLTNDKCRHLRVGPCHRSVWRIRDIFFPDRQR